MIYSVQLPLIYTRNRYNLLRHRAVCVATAARHSLTNFPENLRTHIHIGGAQNIPAYTTKILSGPWPTLYRPIALPLKHSAQHTALLYALTAGRAVWKPDTLATIHFGTKTLRHHEIGHEVSGHFGLCPEVSALRTPYFKI